MLGENLYVYHLLVIILLTGLTLVSGWGDSQGFIHASLIWQDNNLLWSEVLKSAGGFALGIGTYWLCIRFFQELGVVSSTVQTIGWFSITIIGVALSTGKFFQWQLVDQIVGCLVVLGIIWLLMRTAAS